MSSFDAMLTTVPEDVREAIEEVCNEAGTFDADWCILKAAGELIVKSRTLPPVSPENLVEGEWYVFNYHTAFIPMIGKAEIHQGKFRLVDSFHSSKWSWANSETDIYGPLRFKIGGAE